MVELSAEEADWLVLCSSVPWSLRQELDSELVVGLTVKATDTFKTTKRRVKQRDDMSNFGVVMAMAASSREVMILAADLRNRTGSEEPFKDRRRWLG